MLTVEYEVSLLLSALFLGWFAHGRPYGDNLPIYLRFVVGIVFPSALALLSPALLGTTPASLTLVPLGYAGGAAWAFLFEYPVKGLSRRVKIPMSGTYPDSDPAPATTTRLRQLGPLARIVLVPLFLLMLTAIPALSFGEEHNPPAAQPPCVSPGGVISLAQLPTPTPTKETDTLAVKIDSAVRQNNLPALIGLFGDLSKLGAAYGEDGIDFARDATAKGEDLATSMAKDFMHGLANKSGANTSDGAKEFVEYKIREMRAADSAAKLGKKLMPERSAVAYFELGKSGLVTSANSVAAAVAREYVSTRRIIFVVGSADRSGQAGRNHALAAERAISFQAALEAHGVERRRIYLRTRSALGLPVSTSEGVTEPENRRVDVFIR